MTPYDVPYEVEAPTKYAAIAAAALLLRTDVRIERVLRVVPTAPGWWEVTFRLEELDGPDPNIEGMPEFNGAFKTW